MMTDLCGIVRERTGLERARARSCRSARARLLRPRLTVAEMELFNLLTVAEHIVESAAVREESRGVHLRSDFPSGTTSTGGGTSSCTGMPPPAIWSVESSPWEVAS